MIEWAEGYGPFLHVRASLQAKSARCPISRHRSQSSPLCDPFLTLQSDSQGVCVACEQSRTPAPEVLPAQTRVINQFAASHPWRNVKCMQAAPPSSPSINTDNLFEGLLEVRMKKRAIRISHGNASSQLLAQSPHLSLTDSAPKTSFRL